MLVQKPKLKKSCDIIPLFADATIRFYFARNGMDIQSSIFFLSHQPLPFMQTYSKYDLKVIVYICVDKKCGSTVGTPFVHLDGRVAGRGRAHHFPDTFSTSKQLFTEKGMWWLNGTRNSRLSIYNCGVRIRHLASLQRHASSWQHNHQRRNGSCRLVSDNW